uniref:Uncharacterized protein n=1 Tax=Sphaerodactylus townsendi TaxID=933632 RepID=A0ACB8FH13_9SAUR
MVQLGIRKLHFLKRLTQNTPFHSFLKNIQNHLCLRVFLIFVIAYLTFFPLTKPFNKVLTPPRQEWFLQTDTSGYQKTLNSLSRSPFLHSASEVLLCPLPSGHS